MQPIDIMLKMIWNMTLRKSERLKQKSERLHLLSYFCVQSASMRKLQDQNESYQANRAKMTEGMALALEKKDQEWMEKLATLEQVKILCNILDKDFRQDCRA